MTPITSPDRKAGLQGLTSEYSAVQSVFSISPESSRVAVILPAFRMGLKLADYEQVKAEDWMQYPTQRYHYRGETSAVTAIKTVTTLIAILGRLFESHEVGDRITITTDEHAVEFLESSEFTHFIFLGTRSHAYSSQILREYSKDFEFAFDKDMWSIIDKRQGQTFSVPDPTQSVRPRRPGSQGTHFDYALIEKVVDEVSNRVIFVIGGMWDTGTLAAGKFIAKNLDVIFRQFGSGGFQYVLEIPDRSTDAKIVLERSPRSAV